MRNQHLNNIVIVGGGTAGWMAAASLVNFVDKVTRITLVESPQIGTIGVGEATLPGIREFNASLGIDEVDFIRATQATFKLAIQFKGWRTPSSVFYHPFASYGTALAGVPFYQAWRRAKQLGLPQDLSDFCLPIALCQANKFGQPQTDPQNPLADYKYAFHFDASLYANYLKRYAIERGVIHKQANVTQVERDAQSGFISTLQLDTDERLSGELFIDCSGFRGLLIEESLKTGFEDWSHWLPVDRAIAVPCESSGEPSPYTVSAAREAGWQWCIPLQHRVGNGYVFCSEFISEDEATAKLMERLPGPALAEPRMLRFKTGRRKLFWNKNCVALGLASGFVEPLESTSISLIQTALSKLLMFFPSHGFNQAEIDEANRLNTLEYERIRDFIILHYKLTERRDTELWQRSAALDVPDSLAHKIELFKSRGHLVNYEQESFMDASWITMYNGFGVQPKHQDLRAIKLDPQRLLAELDAMHKMIGKAAQFAPSQQAFIDRHCRAQKV